VQACLQQNDGQRAQVILQDMQLFFTHQVAFIRNVNDAKGDWDIALSVGKSGASGGVQQAMLQKQFTDAVVTLAAATSTLSAVQRPGPRNFSSPAVTSAPRSGYRRGGGGMGAPTSIALPGSSPHGGALGVANSTTTEPTAHGRLAQRLWNNARASLGRSGPRGVGGRGQRAHGSGAGHLNGEPTTVPGLACSSHHQPGRLPSPPCSGVPCSHHLVLSH